MKLADVLARLEGVRRSAGYYIARCPAHDDRNPSLSICESESGKALLKCFAGCSFEAIRDALGERPGRQSFGFPASGPHPALDDAKRTEIARRIWRESRPATGTLVEVYMRSRGITIPPPLSLRFHPSLKHPTGVFAPAMVAGVQNREGRIVAIHRTWLKPDGSGKADVEPQKAMLGPCAGGAVRFAKPSETIALAEGIETALSALQATGIPTWAALSTSGMRSIQLPAEVQGIILIADGDQPGEAAARAAALRFIREGRKARIARPRTGRDFNDLLRDGVEA